MKKNKKGFTLVELMIVVAIIAILAAVALPAFGQQIRKSKDGRAIQLIGSMRAQVGMVISEMEGTNPKSDSAEMGNLFIESAGLIVTGEDDTTKVTTKGVTEFNKYATITGNGTGNVVVGTCIIGTDVTGYTNWTYNSANGVIKFSDSTAKTTRESNWASY